MNSSPRGRGTDQARPVPDLAFLTLPQLRTYRADLSEERDRVAYWRRLLTARLHAIAEQEALPALPASERHRSLGPTGSGARRATLAPLHPSLPLPPLPDPDGAWARAWTPPATDTPATTSDPVAIDTRSALDRLIAYHDAVQARLSAATSDLIARYARDQTAAFSLTDPNPGN